MGRFGKKNFLIRFCSNILFLFYYIFIKLFIKIINLINDDCVLVKSGGILVKSGGDLVIQWGHFGSGGVLTCILFSAEDYTNMSYYIMVLDQSTVTFQKGWGRGLLQFVWYCTKAQ